MLRAIKIFLVTLSFCICKQGFAYIDNSVNLDSSNNNVANSQDAARLCMDSFNETRDRVMSSTTQSVIVLTGDGNISPFITLQSSSPNGNQYVLWQSLNGAVKGYALRNGKGFDYSNNALNPMPLSWHPTLIWDNLFSSKKVLKNYSCVLTGRTRVMGKKVSLIRLIPQEGLRFSFILAKEDESDFPVELTVIDSKGLVASRLTTMESRIVGGVDFPIKDSMFDNAIENSKNYFSKYKNNTSSNKHISSTTLSDPSKVLSDEVVISKDIVSSQEISSNHKQDNQTSISDILANDNQGAGASLNKDGIDDSVIETREAHELSNINNRQDLIWPELNIPSVYTLVYHGRYKEGGPECFYQEFSDGITSFRVYRNKRSSIFYPVLTNGSLSVFRKNSLSNEYSVVGEVPISLAEYVLTKIRD